MNFCEINRYTQNRFLAWLLFCVTETQVTTRRESLEGDPAAVGHGDSQHVAGPLQVPAPWSCSAESTTTHSEWRRVSFLKSKHAYGLTLPCAARCTKFTGSFWHLVQMGCSDLNSTSPLQFTRTQILTTLIMPNAHAGTR